MSVNRSTTAAPPHQPRVVIQFRNGTNPWGDSAAPASVASAAPDWQATLRAAQQGIEIERLIPTSVVSTTRLKQLNDAARGSLGDRMPELHNFASVRVRNTDQCVAVIRAARGIPIVAAAYVAGVPHPPPINASDDPRAASQGYLNAAPTGIDARYAWGQANGNGTGVTVVDLEQGWTLTHEDFPAGIPLLSGLNQPHPAVPQHGTSVLGELVMQDNTKGGVGIVPGATAKVISQWRNSTTYNTGAAIIDAAVRMRRGDVLLLEAQTTVNGSTFLPVECELAEWVAIRVASSMGIIVVEAGGNGSNDLDAWTDPIGLGKRLKRGDAAFLDSGAIMVGAANSSTRARMGFSNYGSRIDCFAWGQNITTADASATPPYTTSFSGTSGASPIVTGAAVSVNAMMRARIGIALGPDDMRRVLTNVRDNTASAAPANDRIGVMPNLKKIFDNYIVHHSATGGPGAGAGRTAMGGVALVVDAGHGGDSWTGRSSAWGHADRYGGLEKDVAFAVATAVADRFGGAAALTRGADDNPALASRASRARELGASHFVSVHAGSPEGPQVWVYGNGYSGPDPRSAAYGQRLARALSATYGQPVPVYAGPMAVLDPSLLGGVVGALVDLPATDDGDPDVAAGAIAKASADDVDEEPNALGCGHVYGRPADWPAVAPAPRAPVVPTGAAPPQLATFARPAFFDKPARELTRAEARDIVVYLCGQRVPGTNQAEMTLMSNATTARWPAFSADGSIAYPRAVASSAGNVPISTTFSCVQYTYAAGTTPAYTNAWRGGLDLRMAVFAWRFAKWARETWGATHIYNLGFGSGSVAGRALDAHTEGRAIDFSGIEGTRNGTRYRYLVHRDWGQQPVPGRTGGWGTATTTTYRLPVQAAPSAHAAFLDVYNFLKTQCVDGTLTTRATPAGVLYPGNCSAGFIIHPDYPGVSLRSRHQDHIHAQIGATRDPTGAWP